MLMHDLRLRDRIRVAESACGGLQLDGADLAKIRPVMIVRGQVLAEAGSGTIGGAERQTLKLSRALKGLGVQVKIVAVQTNQQRPRLHEVEGVPIDELKVLWRVFERKGLRRIGVYLYMLRLLLHLLKHRGEFNIIHAHSALTGAFISVLAGHWLEKRVIVKVMNSGHRNDLKRLRTSTGLIGASRMAEYIRGCDRIIALNQLAAAELREMGFVDEQIVHIPNGVEVDEIEPKVDYTLSKPVRLVYVGRLHKAKGIDKLLIALQSVWQRCPQQTWLLTLLGTGPLYSELLELAEELDVASLVHFQGQVQDVSPFLKESDVFVLPSRAEGISNALLEAMACGLPCVATDNAGNCTLISHEQDGLLVPVDDSEALAEAILRCADDKRLRERLGRNARATVESQYSIDSVAKRYASLYLQLVKES
jgi:glycosyltransferase involved in cell wall biosynthesis